MISYVNSNNNKKMNYARGAKRIYFIIAFIWFFITSSYVVDELEESLFVKFFLITFVSTCFPYAVYLIIEWILKGFKK